MSFLDVWTEIFMILLVFMNRIGLWNLFVRIIILLAFTDIKMVIIPEIWMFVLYVDNMICWTWLVLFGHQHALNIYTEVLDYVLDVFDWVVWMVTGGLALPIVVEGLYGPDYRCGVEGPLLYDYFRLHGDFLIGWYIGQMESPHEVRMG